MELAVRFCRATAADLRAIVDLLQLSTYTLRPDARAFHESLGFEATHVGVKLER